MLESTLSLSLYSVHFELSFFIIISLFHLFLSYVFTCPCVGIHYLVCAETSVDGGGPYQADEALKDKFISFFFFFTKVATIIKAASTCFDWL